MDKHSTLSIFSRAATGRPATNIAAIIALSMLAAPMLCWGRSSGRRHNWPSPGSSAATNVSPGTAHSPTSNPQQPSNPQGNDQAPRAASELAVPFPAGPAEVKEWEIIKQDATKPGDPELGKDYEEINDRHFGDKLPAIPVLWEPRLAEIGPLKAEGYTQKGLWADLGNKAFILLNPVFRQDAAETRRVLCHEVVHEYLHIMGHKQTNHGPDFQAVLRRLSEAGAFEGIPASDEEKASLKSWINAESVRLEEESAWIKAERYELAQADAAIECEATVLNREVLELDQRISMANEQGYGWPSNNEIESSKAQRRAHNQRIMNLQERMTHFNARLDSNHAAAIRLNQAMNRYNFMMVYPDGLEEDAKMQAKAPAGAAMMGAVYLSPRLETR